MTKEKLRSNNVQEGIERNKEKESHLEVRGACERAHDRCQHAITSTEQRLNVEEGNLEIGLIDTTLEK